MKRPTIILSTALVTAAICTAIFFNQAAHRTTVASDIERVRQEIGQLEESLGTAPPRSSLKSAINPSGSLDANQLSSDQKVARGTRRIETILRPIGSGQIDSGEILKVLPEVLSEIDAFTVEEIVALADNLDASIKPGSGDAKSRLKYILLLLAAEHEPLAILQREDVLTSSDLPAMILGSLAKDDPGAAQDWLENAEIKVGLKSQLWQAITFRVMRDDFEAGLELLRRDQTPDTINQSSGRLAQVPLPERVLDQAGAALRLPENADLKPMIVHMVLGSTTFHRGVDGARQAAERYGLSEPEVAAFLTDQGRTLAKNDPQATITWMLEGLSAEQQEAQIPVALGSWAQRDFNAAGEFLGEMERSDIRDQSIARFAQSVARLDPKAAAIWSLEIEDEANRSQSLEAVVRQWRAVDPTAADAWLSENGLEP